MNDTTYTVVDRKTGKKTIYTLEGNTPVAPVIETTQPAESVETKVDKL